MIVIHEMFGLTDDIRRITRRFAANGYAALAPDLYSTGPRLRDGGRPVRPLCIRRTVQNMRDGSGPAFDDLDAARQWLAARAEVDAARLAVAGFCLGGGFALLTAARSVNGADLSAAAAFYGQAPRRAERLAGSCPLYAAYGAHDPMTSTHAPRLQSHLEALGVEHEVVVYPDAGHSFMNQHGGLRGAFIRVVGKRVGYREETAEQAWTEMLDFFARTLNIESDTANAD